MSAAGQTDERIALLWAIEALIRNNLRACENNLSLGNGMAGIALFYSELYQLTSSSAVGGTLDEIVELIHRRISHSAFEDDGLLSGIPGVGFALEIIAEQRGFPMAEVAGLNADVDELVLEYVSSTKAEQSFDLVSGLAGLGLYALSRNDRAARKRIFSAVFTTLMACSTGTEIGRKWRTNARFASARMATLYPDGYDDLGIAHGNAGVIALLARAVRMKVPVAGLPEALREASDWLLAQRRPGDIAFGQVGDDSHPRNAWCAGDAGVSVALVRSGAALADEGLRRAGWEVGAQSTRRGRESARVGDHGLCHGSMGLSLLYRHLYALTGDAVFAGAARSWQRATVASVSTHSLNALATWRGPASPPVMTLGLVNGVAGIGLSLIDAISDGHGRWSNCLAL